MKKEFIKRFVINKYIYKLKYLNLYDELHFNTSPKNIKYTAKNIHYSKHKTKDHPANTFLKYYSYYKHFTAPLIIPKNIDIHLKPFHTSDRYLFIKELYENKSDYTKTKRYQQLHKVIASGEIVKMKKKYILRSERDLHAYFNIYQKLLEGMKKDGYKQDIVQDQLMLIIGPNGELIKEKGGKHRLAAAQITGVRRVPVRIKYIHQTWIESQMDQRLSSSGTIGSQDIKKSLHVIHQTYAI